MFTAVPIGQQWASKDQTTDLIQQQRLGDWLQQPVRCCQLPIIQELNCFIEHASDT